MPFASNVTTSIRVLSGKARRFFRRVLGAGARLAQVSVQFAAAKARTLAQAPKRRQLARNYTDLLQRRIAFTTELGSPDDSSLVIVVCLWNRPGRLPDILRLVDSQTCARPLRLVLWNNRANNAAAYSGIIRNFRSANALSSVEVFNSPTNVGGIGRFIAMRELVRRGYSGPFVMLDDDQDVTPAFVGDLLAEYSPRSVCGVWAWRNNGRYWNREQITGPGMPVNHVGTGGSVCDSTLVRSEQFFTAIPARYLFIEDMWMCHYALRNGWSMRSVDSPVQFVQAELDQGHAIFDLKEEFFSWLQDPDRIPLESPAQP